MRPPCLIYISTRNGMEKSKNKNGGIHDIFRGICLFSFLFHFSSFPFYFCVFRFFLSIYLGCWNAYVVPVVCTMVWHYLLVRTSFFPYFIIFSFHFIIFALLFSFSLSFLVLMTQIRVHMAGSCPPSSLRFVPCIFSREDFWSSPFFPRRLSSNCAYPRY